MLVLTNGTLGWTDNKAPLTDEDGNVIPGDNCKGKVECFIEVLQEDRSGFSEAGWRSNQRYTVMVDMDSVPNKFAPVAIKLVDENKGDLGVFTVQRIQHYPLTRSIKIWT